MPGTLQVLLSMSDNKTGARTTASLAHGVEHLILGTVERKGHVLSDARRTTYRRDNRIEAADLRYPSETGRLVERQVPSAAGARAVPKNERSRPEG